MDAGTSSACRRWALIPVTPCNVSTLPRCRRIRALSPQAPRVKTTCGHSYDAELRKLVALLILDDFAIDVLDPVESRDLPGRSSVPYSTFDRHGS